MNEPVSVLRAPDDDIVELLQAMALTEGGGIEAVDRLLQKWPDDARIHFLKGSLLAGDGNPIEAHRSLSRAIQLDPSFDIARFQLGFFELTSGEADAALATWKPLESLPAVHYLSHFIAGLRALISDRFAECIACLEQGISANQDNAPLNSDMALIIEKCAEILRSDPGGQGQGQSADHDLSATSLLLNRFPTS